MDFGNYAVRVRAARGERATLPPGGGYWDPSLDRVFNDAPYFWFFHLQKVSAINIASILKVTNFNAFVKANEKAHKSEMLPSPDTPKPPADALG